MWSTPRPPLITADDLTAYGDASRLPCGFAAAFAACAGVSGAAVGMASTWYVAPLALDISAPFGGDIVRRDVAIDRADRQGFELSAAFAGIVRSGLCAASNARRPIPRRATSSGGSSAADRADPRPCFLSLVQVHRMLFEIFAVLSPAPQPATGWQQIFPSTTRHCRVTTAQPPITTCSCSSASLPALLLPGPSSRPLPV